MMVTVQSTKSIYDLNLDEIRSEIDAWGEPKFRPMQIWFGLYKDLWEEFDQFSNLPQSLRAKLSEVYSLKTFKTSLTQASDDQQTQKSLFLLSDGKFIETVLMRYRKRNTLCISTQAGCAMGCVFCATGQMGFFRNLSSGEIVEQVLYFKRQLTSIGESITHVVFMGMGEPFHNYDATMAAIDRLNHPEGLNFGARRFTISTVGLVPAIKRFAAENRQVNLAISLHAADDELRSSLVPINRKYPLDELLDACLEYVQLTHRRVSFEWAMIEGVNDDPQQARLLSERLQVFRRQGAALCHVNIIPLNPTGKYQGMAAHHKHVIAFQKLLKDKGISCTIRVRRGIDIQAGCGQLVGNVLVF